MEQKQKQLVQAIGAVILAIIAAWTAYQYGASEPPKQPEDPPAAEIVDVPEVNDTQ